MKAIRILPASDTFDSKGAPLGAGALYVIPDEISAEDAQICVDQGKAEALDENGNVIVAEPAAELAKQ